ncbi:uncharacterized protein LOC128724589 [Anopheles nili]|uniref:uncharacterized protein LOC128724589 n=1 Tax=Anopheles nili TaxID=185578 RepID=UPI00237AB3EB|nr:uncharacterized protein LOC128724589 [Anopheles nili]
MNSDYVKKCTDFLQNIPAHKLAATNATAVGQTNPNDGAQQQPQSKPSIGNKAAKNPSRRGQPASPAVVGVGGKKRPIWRHPAAGPVAPPRYNRPVPTEEQKFVRSCCPSLTHRGSRRVDSRWEGESDKNPAPICCPTFHPVCDTISPVETVPKQTGRGDGDNVNHAAQVGMDQSREDSEESVDCSTSDIKLQSANQLSAHPVDGKLFHFQPLRTVQFLCFELNNKLRLLGPEHRAVYKIGKELSIAVRFLCEQQRATDGSSSSSVTQKAGPNETQTKPECRDCQLLQRDRQDDRDRHAQESAQLTEQINYLQSQLAVATDLERGVGRTVKEQYRRMEEEIAKLKLVVGEKKTVELVLINDLKRSLKESRAKTQRLERERTELEQRLKEAQMQNDRQELFLNAQAMNFKQVKHELNHIHKLSTKQIEYLDEPIKSLSPSKQRHRLPSMHNYTPALQSSECDTTITLSVATRPPQPPSTTASHPSGELKPRVARTERRNPSEASRGITSETSAKRISSHTGSSLILQESMPSLASQSDRDNSSRGWRSSSSLDIGSAGLGRETPRDDNGQDNERCGLGINRPDHEPNRIRHRSDASASDYGTGRFHRKLTATDGHASGADRRWNRDDKMQRPVGSSSSVPSSSGGSGEDDKNGRHRSDRPVTPDGHRQFVTELAENITLPASPRPFRHELSLVQLSEDEPVASDDELAGGMLDPAREGYRKFTKQLQPHVPWVETSASGENSQPSHEDAALE